MADLSIPMELFQHLYFLLYSDVLGGGKGIHGYFNIPCDFLFFTDLNIFEYCVLFPLFTFFILFFFFLVKIDI